MVITNLTETDFTFIQEEFEKFNPPAIVGKVGKAIKHPYMYLAIGHN